MAVAAVVVAASLALPALWEVVRRGTRRGVADGAGPLTIERVRALSELATLTVRTADVRVASLGGITGSTHALLLVHGEVRLGVDLSAGRFEHVDAAARRVVLVLPEPAVQSARLDHGRTRILRMWDDGLWAVTPGGGDAEAAVVTASHRDAEQALGEVARHLPYAEQAKAQAERVLRAFVEAFGWDVEVRWAG